MSAHGLHDLFGLWPEPEDDPALPALEPAPRAALARAVPGWRGLTPAERRRLVLLTRRFLAEKEFEPCEGFRLTDAMRATIAGQACLLLLGLDAPVYPGLRSVLVYPDSYRAACRFRAPTDGVVAEGVQGRRGEAWKGLVVLAWRRVRRGTPGEEPGQNLVLHEFAHELAAETGGADGLPQLRDPARDRAWRRALLEGRARLAEDVEAGRPAVLRPYGATNAAEFFAVLTEAFFETPAAVRGGLPRLYALLRELYRQDPAARVSRPA